MKNSLVRVFAFYNTVVFMKMINFSLFTELGTYLTVSIESNLS